nr:hypothetical protein Iba_chr04bCG13750 [Ipomoea batatas]
MNKVTPTVCDNVNMRKQAMVAVMNDVPAACDQGENVYVAVDEGTVTNVMEEEREKEVCEENTSPVCEKASLREEGLHGLQLKEHAIGAAGESEKVKPASAHVTEEGRVVFEEKEGNDGCKVAGVVISSNNHQQEKEICSIPCSSKQQKAMNAKEPEQCVTPKRKGIGVLDTEKIIAQFSKEMTAIIQESIERKERKGKGGGTEGSVSAQARVKDVSEGSEKGERGLKNTMEWVKVVEELMKKDKGFDQKVKEALKEVNTYLWTVYDKKKEEYVEEGRNRAMRAATIFLVKVKLCPSWNRENGMLGKYLKANIDAVGARICHWAVTLNLNGVVVLGLMHESCCLALIGVGLENGRSNGLRRIKRQWALPFVTADGLE